MRSTVSWPGPREGFIRSLFDRIAPGYDLMNRVMTGGIWWWWQRRLFALAGLRPGERVLDVGCGTGDLSFWAARLLGPEGEVVGVDISPRMLARARKRLLARRPGAGAPIRFLEADALSLPFPDNSFDVVLTGFVLRNLPELSRGLREMFRVLRPGGRFFCLELSQPPSLWVRSFFRFYLGRVVPLLGFWARTPGGSGPSPYRWIFLSWADFPGPGELGRMLAETGFSSIRWHSLSGGIACIHLGRKPC